MKKAERPENFIYHTPCRNGAMRIPPFKYYFPERSIRNIANKVERLLQSGDFLTQGKYSEEFERKFASYIGVKHAIAVSNGTAALEIIFQILDVKGSKVLIPTNTFAATAYGVIRAGGRPVFVDIDKDLNFSLSDISRKLDDQVRAVVPVHIGGLISPRLLELLNMAEEKGIHVVEDAAHAHGSELNGRKAGTFGIANAFSFFSTKVMTTGEGGMITTNDDEIAEKAKILRNQGKIKGNLIGMMGYNWRMTELQAIIGLEQLELLPEIIEKRRRVAKTYDELLEGVRPLEMLKIPDNVRSNYYKYIVFLPRGCNPEVLKAYLREKFGVILAGYVYEVPLHRQPVFKEYVNDSDSYPMADDLCYRHIALPIYPRMTEEEIHYVVDSLKASLRALGWM